MICHCWRIHVAAPPSARHQRPSPGGSLIALIAGLPRHRHRHSPATAGLRSPWHDLLPLGQRPLSNRHRRRQGCSSSSQTVQLRCRSKAALSNFREGLSGRETIARGEHRPDGAYVRQHTEIIGRHKLFSPAEVQAFLSTVATSLGLRPSQHATTASSKSLSPARWTPKALAVSPALHPTRPYAAQQGTCDKLRHHRRSIHKKTDANQLYLHLCHTRPTSPDPDSSHFSDATAAH